MIASCKPLLPSLARLEALLVPEYTQLALFAASDHDAVAELPVELLHHVLVTAEAIRQEEVPLIHVVVRLPQESLPHHSEHLAWLRKAAN